MLKDFDGNEIQIGDTVAVIYHPRAYKFSVESATVKEVKGVKSMIVTQLLSIDDAMPSYLPDGSGEIYPKLVKINSSFPKVPAGKAIDAVGHEIHLGDRIACKKEVVLNTLKGFEIGGIVERMTEHYVFYIDAITGETKRKGFNGVVVY